MMARTTDELTKIWVASLLEQNGTERRALRIYEYPEGPAIVARDLNQSLHFAEVAELVADALMDAIKDFAPHVRKGMSLVYCPVEVRDAQKNGHVLYDLFAAIKQGELIAVNQTLIREKARQTQEARERASQPTLHDVVEWLGRSLSAIDYLQIDANEEESRELSLAWGSIKNAHRRACALRRVH